MPLKSTVTRQIDTIVTTAVIGPSFTQSHAAGARFRPMSATIAPVTTGGIAASIQRTPAKWTIRPTSVSVAPVAMMPPSA